MTMRRTLTAILAMAAAMLTAAPAQAAPAKHLVLPAPTGHDRIGAPSPCYPAMRFVR
jgi:hypothetical protein